MSATFSQAVTVHLGDDIKVEVVLDPYDDTLMAHAVVRGRDGRAVLRLASTSPRGLAELGNRLLDFADRFSQTLDEVPA